MGEIPGGSLRDNSHQRGRGATDVANVCCSMVRYLSGVLWGKRSRTQLL